MKKLPFALQLPFFNVLMAKSDLSALENWVYQQSDLENFFSEDDFLS